MVEENIFKEFRLKNIDETKNYFAEEIIKNDLMSKKNKKVCTALSCIEDLFILFSVVSGDVSGFSFASLVGILIGIAIYEVRLKVLVIMQELKSMNQQLRESRKSIIKYFY